MPILAGSPAIAFAKNHPHVIKHHKKSQKAQKQNLVAMPIATVSGDPSHMQMQRRLTEDAIAVCQQQLLNNLGSAADIGGTPIKN